MTTVDQSVDQHGQAVVKTVTLTIDDVEVTVPEGTLIIRAAEQIGIQIPRFCDHPLLDPVGACRQCLVDVPDAGNGRPMPKPQASCTIPVAAGMVVRTQKTSPVADKAQQGIMEFLLINHPLDCPVCDKGGECPLQNQAMTNGRGETRFLETKRTFPKPINISARGAARPRALRAVRPLHALQRADRRRPVHHDARARRAAAGRHLREGAVRVLLLGQHDPDLPGRRPHVGVVPVPVPPVRPGLHAVGVRALRVGLRAPDRLPARQGHAPTGGQRPGGQRGVELRQGPVRLHVGPGRRPADQPAWCATRRAASCAGVLAGGVLRRGQGPRGRRRGRRRAARWSADRRGRLRLQPVRACGPRHQQHRLPEPRRCPTRRRTSWPSTSRPGRVRRTPISSTPTPSCWSASSPRTSRRSSSSGCARRSVSTAPASTRSPPTPRTACPSSVAGCSRRPRVTRRRSWRPWPTTPRWPSTRVA